MTELYFLRIRDNNDLANQGCHRRDEGALLFDCGFKTVGVTDDLTEDEGRRVADFLRQHCVDAARS